MPIRQSERNHIAEICREELTATQERIIERIGDIVCAEARNKSENFDSVRRFYEDLSDNPWSESDEQFLASMGEVAEANIKRMMREGFRRSRLQPVPSFAYLINLAKKENSQPLAMPNHTGMNPDAISAIERERLANLLYRELNGAAREIAARLHLDENKSDIVRDQLEVAQGQIISRFTPLV